MCDGVPSRVTKSMCASWMTGPGSSTCFWPGVLIVEQKSAGRDLERAYGQAGEYFDAAPRTRTPPLHPGQRLQDLRASRSRRTGRGRLSALRPTPAMWISSASSLAWSAGPFRDQDPANIEAAELVGRLHEALEAAGYRGHNLERFLVRIVFCLFADDTGIFEPRDIFLDLIETRTREDGSDTGSRLAELFQVLDTPEAARQTTLDEDFARFPYVDGDLFNGALRIPSFNSAMRGALLDACHFDWSNISPAIFGALFQSVMAPEERRAQGAHYTTEKNILKVIGPLFLDDLRAKFNRLRARKDKRRRGELTAFQKRLGGMKFFDPGLWLAAIS